jgi:hypothetical protein
MTGGPHPSAAGGGRAREAGRLGRWRWLGWAAGGDAQTRGKTGGRLKTLLENGPRRTRAGMEVVVGCGEGLGGGWLPFFFFLLLLPF